MKFWYMFPCVVNENNISKLIATLFEQFYADPKVEITLYISSIGGDIDSAIRFYDFIKATEININTVGFGQVDSSSIILFLSGKERTLIKNCRLRLHAPTYSANHQSQMIAVPSETASFLKYMDNRYFEILSNELPKFKKIREVYNKGKILSPNDSLELGIATKIEQKLPINK